MKSRIFLLSAFLFVLTMFHPVTAKADLLGDLFGGLFGGGGKGGSGGSGGGTNLPINGGIVILLIAALAIGILAIRKTRAARASKV